MAVTWHQGKGSRVFGLEKLYYHLLPRLGINRHFPKVMINVPAYMGGIGLPKYEWE